MQYMHVAPAQLQPGDTLYADMGQVVASVAPAGGPWGGVVVRWVQAWLPPAHYAGRGANAIARVAVKRGGVMVATSTTPRPDRRVVMQCGLCGGPILAPRDTGMYHSRCWHRYAVDGAQPGGA